MISGDRWKLGHRPGLDGLRGIAILMVMSAHTWNFRLNSGTGGVTVFFGLSGFLITALLLDEHQRAGRVSFRGFYLRRARRLLPALFAYLAVWSVLAVAGWNVLGLHVRDVIATLTYSMNWIKAGGYGVSQVVGHTWSLAVEEQFYLLWPLTFLAAGRWPRLPATTAVLGILAAVVLRLTAWDGPASGFAIYHRSDTRMDSLMLGCLLAIVVKWNGGVHRRWRHAGWPGLVLLIVVLFWRNDAFNYLMVPLVASLAACALIMASLAGSARWLENPALRWFGRRSYALYLWHFPIAVLAWPGLHLYPMWVAVVLSLVAAEASWWLVERRFIRRRQATRPQVPEPSQAAELEPTAAACAAIRAAEGTVP